MNKEKVFYKGQENEKLNSYKYLGNQLCRTRSFRNHLENKLSSGKAALNTIWNSYFKQNKKSLYSKYKDFDSAVVSIMLYGGQIWGI